MVWTLLLIGLAAGLLRAIAIAWSRRVPVSPVLVLLGFVGLQTAAIYVTSCDVRDPTLIRYTLLTLLIPIAVAGWYLEIEHRRELRFVAMLLMVVWAGWSVTQYAPLVQHYRMSPPVSDQASVAEALVRRGIRFARAGYWDAHHITFLSGERVIVASDYPYRILTYDTLVSRGSGVIYIQREPCPGGEFLSTRWLCRIE